ncbi:MAG: beta-lactamase family protein, partial [Flavobacteriaceae bacterium]|nr:beta-lactamase family protein [Flavobacteriaceae bacterium]
DSIAKVANAAQEPLLYTASITKLFTATAIAILHEQGKLSFSDKLYRHVSESTIAKLHTYNGVDYSKQITIAQLLQHRSGLEDYFTGKTTNNTSNMLEQIVVAPKKFWTPTEILSYYKQHFQARAIPGTSFWYSDTNYVLLGMVIEKISGQTLDAFFKSQLFHPLNMHHSYMHQRSKPIRGNSKLTPFYAGNMPLQDLPSISADWAGGGLVTTTKDMQTFLYALIHKKIVRNRTLKKMQQWVPETYGMAYGFGMRKVDLGTLYNNSNKLEVIGHPGSTASFLWYCPQLDLYIAGSMNQLEKSKASFQMVYEILKTLVNSK